MADIKIPIKVKKGDSKALKTPTNNISEQISTLISLEELKQSNNKAEHSLKMEELEYCRESELIHHTHKMERQRIKTAEIKRTQQRSESARYARAYSKEAGF